MIITLCASLTHYRKSYEVKKTLELMGHTVLWPWGMVEIEKGTLKPRAIRTFKSKHQSRAIIVHYEKIKKSGAIVVVNEYKNGINNYIGGNTLMEMGFAYVLKKPIYLLNPIPRKLGYREEIVAMNPFILSGDISLVSNV